MYHKPRRIVKSIFLRCINTVMSCAKNSGRFFADTLITVEKIPLAENQRDLKEDVIQFFSEWIGAGMRPPREMNLSGETVLISIMGA